ncbi:MAG: tRNA preQ1(34) S-adenosylmethionine ribosyltransferase-isomerase QueA [Syntrophobacterales bacterium RBG_19FT_COMBO_59_10]|nr:MAG: tRNA preQ1(34) S-adenosylmethionine ribosyltransferase-isomerase QueA [Syntrophobacterales bacterium RBG_19FT_COMBO_59_10]
MKLEEFAYDLPEELIAQVPAAARDGSRMMVVDRGTGSFSIRTFGDLPEYLGPGDCLVVNDSRVFPARLIGRKDSGGLIEILLLSIFKGDLEEENVWEALLRPAKRITVGMRITFADGCTARIVRRMSEKRWLLAFTTALPFGDFLDRYGRAPLPPYIKRRRDRSRSESDLERYQTVYARVQGSVAAPTAGLHFTHEVLDRVENSGASIAPVTLHIGYGTFLPIEAAELEDHLMEEEHFTIGEETARMVNEAKRVIAVGTTSTRVLESVAGEGGIRPFSGSTRLYIYPGYRFRRVDALLTNFHLPKSSLFLLVCAFAGRELMQEAYRFAIENRFRFYSYGDCMLIL